MKTLILILIIYFTYTKFFGEESGCDKYASKYSCDYVVNKANYDIYYWENVGDGNPEDEKLIGSTVGLLNCRDKSINYSLRINEPWNDRSYICMLVKDGMNMEKHRYLGN